MDAKKEPFVLSFEDLAKYVLALVLISGTTAIFFFIGRDKLGEGVIALLFLVPISWVTARWGQGPGIAAAIAAALAFNYFFIPPYYTLYIESLEGWLLLFIFLAVAIVVVGRIQVGLAMAQRREREAVFMYELSASLSGVRTPEEIARNLAEQIQQLYQVALVQVSLDGKQGPVVVSLPQGVSMRGKPNRILPILTSKGLVGEICLWQDLIPLPPDDDRLFRNYTNQAALALERVQ